MSRNMIMTNEEFTRTLTKEQREYLQECYEKQLEEAIKHFDCYKHVQNNLRELVEFEKKYYAANWFRFLSGSDTSDLSEKASEYSMDVTFELLRFDKE